MYSPGALNVAVVVALPPSSITTFGFWLSNFTAPGPRNIVQVMAIGGGVNADSGLAPRPAPPRPGAAASPVAPAAASPAPGVVPRAAAPRPRPRPSGTLIFAP